MSVLEGAPESPALRALSRSAPAAPPAHPTVRRLRRGTKGELLVALPRGFTAGREVRPGENLLLTPLADGRLVVSRPDLRGGKVRFDVRLAPTEPPEHGFRRLVAAYLSGAGELVLRAEPGQVRQILPEFLRRTSHLEVLRASGREEVLKDVSEGHLPDFPSLLRRMFQLVLELQRAAGEALAGGIPDPSLERRDDDVDRLAWLLQRGLVQGSKGPPGADGPGADASSGLSYLATARALERVADHAVLLSEAVSRLPPGSLPARFRSSLVGLHQQTLSALGEAQRLLEDPDPDQANRLIDSIEGIRVGRHALLDRLLGHREIGHIPGSCLVPLALILESIDRTAAYGTDLAEIALDAGVEKALSPRSLPDGRAPPERPSTTPRNTREKKEKS